MESYDTMIMIMMVMTTTFLSGSMVFSTQVCIFTISHDMEQFEGV